nr:MAG TPA: hypothetical protein [Bacteriophage sp.]
MTNSTIKMSGSSVRLSTSRLIMRYKCLLLSNFTV